MDFTCKRINILKNFLAVGVPHVVNTECEISSSLFTKHTLTVFWNGQGQKPVVYRILRTTELPTFLLIIEYYSITALSYFNGLSLIKLEYIQLNFSEFF